MFYVEYFRWSLKVPINGQAGEGSKETLASARYSDGRNTGELRRKPRNKRSYRPDMTRCARLSRCKRREKPIRDKQTVNKERGKGRKRDREEKYGNKKSRYK